MSDVAAIQDDALPFHPRKQAAILGHMLLNQTFFEQSRYQIQPGWFEDPRYVKVMGIMLKFRETYKRAPTIDEIRDHPDIHAENPRERTSLQTSIGTAQMETGNYGLDVLRDELTVWLRAKLYRDGVLESQKYYNAQKFDKAYAVVAEQIKKIAQAKFDEEEEISFKDPTGWIKESEIQYEGALTTGLPIFDLALIPEDVKATGGLLKKDTTVLLAPVNVGKTTTLITIAVCNIMRRRHVLLMSHEGRPEDLREKILCCYLGVTKPQLFASYQNPDSLAEIVKATEHISKYLTYIPYNKAGMCIEDVIPIIRRRHELKKSQGVITGFELLVSDYPAKLSTKLAQGGNLARRNIDDIVYEQYVQLALELDIHCLLAIQTNRQGSKDNRDANRLLTMEDVMESWGPMASATNVISINRDVQAAKLSRITFYVAKSRSSQTGTAVVCRSDFAACRSHSSKLGGVSYTGTDPMSDRVDGLLEKYKNQKLPENYSKAAMR